MIIELPLGCLSMAVSEKQRDRSYLSLLYKSSRCTIVDYVVHPTSCRVTLLFESQVFIIERSHIMYWIQEHKTVQQTIIMNDRDIITLTASHKVVLTSNAY